LKSLQFSACVQVVSLLEQTKSRVICAVAQIAFGYWRMRECWLGIPRPDLKVDVYPIFFRITDLWHSREASCQLHSNCRIGAIRPAEHGASCSMGWLFFSREIHTPLSLATNFTILRLVLLRVTRTILGIVDIFPLRLRKRERKNSRARGLEGSRERERESE